MALHCLRALKDAGVKGNRKLRVIFGSAEEIGMLDMPHYFASEQHPDMGFTRTPPTASATAKRACWTLRSTGRTTPLW